MDCGLIPCPNRESSKQEPLQAAAMRNRRQNLSIFLTSLIAVSIMSKTVIRSIAFTAGFTAMVLVLALPLDARAGSLYVVGTTEPLMNPPASGATLGILDTATGQITSIGSLSELSLRWP